MNKKKFTLANTFAITTGILWVLCALFVIIFPGLSYDITRWWLHGLDINPLGYWNMSFEGFLMGGIFLILSAWISGIVYSLVSESLVRESK